MKKFLGFLVFILVLNGCDDGNFVTEEINLEDALVKTCDASFFYKTKGNEAMYFKITDGNDYFKNEITPENEPRVITIPSEASVTYRVYDGEVTTTSICSTPAPLSPSPTLEWIATSGRIEISTTIIYKVADPVTGAVLIDKYNHNIVFKDVNFLKPDGTNQVYETFSFGDYTTPNLGLNLNFNKDNIHQCVSSNTLYNATNGATEALLIKNIDPALLATTNLGVTKIGLASNTTNVVTIRQLMSAIALGTNDSYFCGTTFPTTPELKQEWTAVAGVANVSGIIEVTTTSNVPNAYLHSIRLKGVTFQKNNSASTFYFGNDILIGELLITN
jgi:hypothetical protein